MALNVLFLTTLVAAVVLTALHKALDTFQALIPVLSDPPRIQGRVRTAMVTAILQLGQLGHRTETNSQLVGPEPSPHSLGEQVARRGLPGLEAHLEVGSPR